MLLRILILVCCVVWVLGEPTINQQSCEVTRPDNTTAYQACTSRSEKMTLVNYTLGVQPNTSTCGFSGEQTILFRLDGKIEERQCDGNDPNKRHPPEYMVDSSTDTYWQSVAWTNYPTPLNINITFSFNKLYTLQNDLKITFKLQRPAIMSLMKSMDFGQTWTVMEYYAMNCEPYFEKGVAKEITKVAPDTVVCNSSYSSRSPYQGGQVVFSVVNRYSLIMGAALIDYKLLFEGYQSTNILSFLSFTDLKIALIEPATESRYASPQYHYGITDIEMSGSCACNLHAEQCINKDGRTVCDCKHNTAGDDCERCLPLYNNRPWAAGSYLPYDPNGELQGTANECQKCQCNDHADNCTFEPSLGRGKCLGCYHNTTGNNCELCVTGFYKNTSVPINHPDTCEACNCEMLGVLNNITGCSALGQCTCKALVTGLRCDRCINTFYGLLLEPNTGTCKDCECNLDGTIGGSNICEPFQGQCPCKPNTGTRDCSQCKDGFYNFPAGRRDADCFSCGCDPGGSDSQVCDKVTGQCPCHTHTQGLQCRTLIPGYYSPALDANIYQPRLTGSTCTLTSTVRTVDSPFSGRVYTTCRNGQSAVFEEVDGSKLPQPAAEWYYRPVVRYSLNGPAVWKLAILQVAVTGSSDGKVCPIGAGQTYNFPINNMTTGYGVSWVSNTNVTINNQCKYSVQLSTPDGGDAIQPIIIDSVILLPDWELTNVFSLADTVGKASVIACIFNTLNLRTRAAANSDSQCQRTAYSVGMQMAREGQVCDCDITGTVGGTNCNQNGGQCVCKPGVGGRRCDICEPGYYNFTSQGCVACNCSPEGSTSLVCDYVTGQCPCRANVALASQSNVLGLAGDRQCRSCIVDYFGHQSMQGCQPCNCNEVGRNKSQCDDFGQCECKLTIGGDKCDRCVPGYYLFSITGCIVCNCTEAGSTANTCDAANGMCTCRENVEGNKCDTCKRGSFNLDAANPDGCQKCFCYGHGTQCTSAEGYVKDIIAADNAQSWALSDPITAGVMTHLQAPANFLGNRISSFGQLLTFRVQAIGTQPVAYGDSKAVVLAGYGKQVYYNSSDVVAGSGYTTVSIPLSHHDWHYNETTQPDYFNFYAILSDLQAIHLQNIFVNRQVDIRDISLVSSAESTAGEVVKYVETCTCEQNTAGMSCQQCTQGFQRQTINGSIYETCKACNCGGRGDTSPPMCNEATGVCLNCRNGTVGDQCESCAPNVVPTDPQCATCQDQFFGLGKDGCRACGCDSVGSTSPICDKASGQCVCRPHVVGHKCDECEDNFYNLTATGCQECSTCYALIKIEVNKLREMNKNLTDFVDQISTADKFEELGYFNDRLQNTLAQMASLTSFLQAATLIEGSVNSEIERLNNTLVQSQFHIEVNGPQLATQANDSLSKAHANLQTTELLRNATITTTQQGHALLTGPIAAATIQMQALVLSVEDYLARLSQVSNTALADVIKVTGQATQIEEQTSRAQTMATSTLQTTSAGLTKHTQTSQRVKEVEEFVSMVMMTYNDVTSSVSASVGNSSALLNTVNQLRQNITTTPSISTDANGMQAKAQQLITEAAAFNQQATNSTVGQGSVVERVNAARDRTAQLIGQLNAAEATADLLHNRTMIASDQATAAQQKEATTFKDAAHMLDTMQNFDARAREVETAANTSLNTVQSVTEKSTQTIVSSQSLKSTLAPTYETAMAAQSTSNGVYDTAVADQNAIDRLKQQSDAVKVEADTKLTDVDIKAAHIVNTNTTVIQPAKTTTDGVEATLREIEARTGFATGNATQASNNVASTKTRIAALTASLQSIQTMSATELQELTNLVTQQKASIDMVQLTAAVNNMKQKVAEQNEWLTNMKARKTRLQEQIQRLKDVRRQLSP